ncbi:MAG: helix-turn-helix domain-containing protein, partial [Alphaproteobacteria bacterium]
MSKEALNWLNGLNKTDVRLKPTAWRLLECLAMHHRPETGCYISQARLADEANISRGTVNNHLAILERHGFIARERRGSSVRGVLQSTHYHLPFQPSFDRFKLPPSAVEALAGIAAPPSAIFAPPTVQELDASF